MPREFVNLPLNRFLASGNPLPASEAVSLFIDLLYKLEEDHRKGYVHGGIFPDQIILDTRKGSHILRLSEKRAIEELTPAYRSFVPPESLERAAASPQTDFYSMGVALYALITAHPPFDAQQKDALLVEIRNAKMKQLPSFPSSHEIEWFIRRCLVDVPGRRFASVQEMIAYLKKWMGAAGFKSKISAARPVLELMRMSRALTEQKLISRRSAILLLAFIIVAVAATAIYLWYSASQPVPEIAAGHEIAVPSEQYVERDPTLSPDGSQIAFVSDKAANWELYVKNRNALDSIRISRSPGKESNPRWSPQNDLILYGYEEFNSSPAIYAIPPAGGVPQKLADNAMDGQWSADGKQICYVHPKAGGTADLAVLVFGREPRTILKDVKGLRNPSFSPDADQLVCEMDVGATHGLVLVDVESGKQEILTNEFRDISPAWDWKSGFIYFSSIRGSSQKIYRTQTSGKVEIVTRGPGNDHRPAPSSNAEYIAFYREQIRYDIFAFDPNGGIPKNISPAVGYSLYPLAMPHSDSLWYFEMKEKDMALSRRQDLFSQPSTILGNIATGALAQVSSKRTVIVESGQDLLEVDPASGRHQVIRSNQLLPFMTFADGLREFVSRMKDDVVSYSVKDLKTGAEEILFSLPWAERITRATWLPDHSMIYVSAGALYQWSKQKTPALLLKDCRDFAYKQNSTIAVLTSKLTPTVSLFDLKTRHQKTVLPFNKGEEGMHIDWCLQQRFVCYDRLQPGSDLFLVQAKNQ